MLYAFLFATIIYVNAQSFKPPDCTLDSQCTYLDTDPTAQTGLSLMSISGESFLCSSRFGYCTLTCRNGESTCTTINNSGLIEISGSTCLDEGDGVNKCTFAEDRSCNTNDECAAKSFGNLLPRCDTSTNTCVEATPEPTSPPVTARPTGNPTTLAPAATDPPTMDPITASPSTAPTTTEEGIADCIAACPTSADDIAQACEADINYNLVPLGGSGTFELAIPCQDFANECQAACFVEKTVDYHIKGYDADTQSKARLLYPNPLESFCRDGTCADEPATTNMLSDYEQCIKDCEDEDDYPMKCGGSEVIYTIPISIDCTDVRNKCEAQCFVDQQKEEIATDLGYDVSIIDAGIASQYPVAKYPDGLVSAFCCEGVCSDGLCEDITTSTPADTTTSTPDDDTTTLEPDDLTTTDFFATRDCDDDPYVDADCPPEDPEDGCNVQFNVTLDLCILNRKFTRNRVYRYAKYAYMYAMETVADYSDCVEADLKIIRFLPGYKDNNARNRAKRRPTRKRNDNDDESTCGADNNPDNICCEDLEDICGSDKKSKKYTLEIDTQFTCGSCEKMKAVVTTIQLLLDAFDAAFILECLDLSIDGAGSQLLDIGLEGDNICATGFGDVAMEVTEASLAYINEDGVTEVEITTGNAHGIKYGLALICAFIMAAIY